MIHSSHVRATLTLSFALCIPVIVCKAQGSDLAGLMTIYAASGYFEYTGDGSATLGFITSASANGKVQFTTCKNKTVEVLRTELRESKGKCNSRQKDSGPWQTSNKEIAPVYKVANDSTNTKVLFQNKVIDLTGVNGWKPGVVALPSVRASEPVGFVFKDFKGEKSIAILHVDAAL